MTDKLTVYNLALGHLGKRRLNSLTEPREDRRALDDYWATVTAYCLAQGFWSFALRSTVSTETLWTPATGGSYGFSYGYTRPSDSLLLFAVADNVAYSPQIDRDFVE